MSLVAAAAAVLVLLLVVSIASRSPRPGGSLAGPSIDVSLVAANVLFPFLVVAGIAAALLAATVHRRRGRTHRAYTIGTLISDVMAFTIIAVFLRLLVEVFRRRGDGGGGRLTQPNPIATASAGATAGGGAASGDWRVQLAVALATAAVCAFLGYRLFRRADRDAPREPASSGDVLAEAVEEGLDALRAERDPRRAVIAAYARMEQSFLVAGLPRRASEAPMEYLARVLVQMRVREGPVSRLTGLFERAKFDRRPVDEPMREQAIAALVSIREELWAKT